MCPHSQTPAGTTCHTHRSAQPASTLPVIVLKCLISQQQVPEAISRWKRRHLRIHLGHLQSRDIQNDTRVAAVVLLQGLDGRPAG